MRWPVFEFVKLGHDLFFHFVLIFGIDDAVVAAADEIEIDVAFTLHDGFGLSPVDGAFAVFIDVGFGEAHLFHERQRHAAGIG